MTSRVVVAGGNGFIGRIIGTSLVAGDYEVVVLTRSASAGETAIRQVRWDGRTLGEWTRELESAQALINLAGRSVNCRYNERNRREILESRGDSNGGVGEAHSPCHTPPRGLPYATSATHYKHTLDQSVV